MRYAIIIKVFSSGNGIASFAGSKLFVHWKNISGLNKKIEFVDGLKIIVHATQKQHRSTIILSAGVYNKNIQRCLNIARIELHKATLSQDHDDKLALITQWHHNAFGVAKTLTTKCCFYISRIAIINALDAQNIEVGDCIKILSTRKTKKQNDAITKARLIVQ